MKKSDRFQWKQKWMEAGKNKWMLLILTGLLLVVISLPVSSQKESSGETEITLEKQTETIEMSELEEKLKALLRKVEGVGEVEVILMMGEETDGSFYTASQEKVTGVLIAAQGADNYVVVQNIQEAVMALFQIEAHKIKVMKMK